MLECVVNVSEGRDRAVLDRLAYTLGDQLLDLHADEHHNRSVFTLGGDVLEAAKQLAAEALSLIDLSHHAGVHPRLGVVDVVPFVPVTARISAAVDLREAIEAREAFIAFAATTLDLPCFRYGPERSLPEIRRRAFVDLWPDEGPRSADPRHGASCVGARLPLVAYNLVLSDNDLHLARRIAAAIRSDAIRSLGFSVGEAVQVSCNLVAPWEIGPADCYDLVASQAEIAHAELVGLVPAAVLDKIPTSRYEQLDVDETRTIESRLERNGLTSPQRTRRTT